MIYEIICQQLMVKNEPGDGVQKDFELAQGPAGFLKFTQDDLRGRRVHLVSNKPSSAGAASQAGGSGLVENRQTASSALSSQHTAHKILHDSFEFLVVGNGAQPAKGQVKFNIVPRSMLNRLGQQGGRQQHQTNKQGSNRQGKQEWSNSVHDNVDMIGPIPLDVMSNPAITQDSWLMATVIGGVLSLAAAVVIAIKCTLLRRRRKQEVMSNTAGCNSSAHFVQSCGTGQHPGNACRPLLTGSSIDNNQGSLQRENQKVHRR